MRAFAWKLQHTFLAAIVLASRVSRSTWWPRHRVCVESGVELSCVTVRSYTIRLCALEMIESSNLACARVPVDDPAGVTHRWHQAHHSTTRCRCAVVPRVCAFPFGRLRFPPPSYRRTVLEEWSTYDAHCSTETYIMNTTDALYDTREYAQCSPTARRVMLSDHQPGRDIS